MQIHKNQIIYAMPIIIIGATAVIMQVVMMQELIAQFYGNELCIGATLAFWLIWTAVGSGLLPKLFPLPENGKIRFSNLQLIWTLLILGSLIFARSVKPIFNSPPSELLGFFPIFMITGIVLAPICLLSGYLYTTACSWMPQRNDQFSSQRVYFLESIGAGIGGLMISFVLLHIMTTIQIALLLAGLNLLTALAISTTTLKRWMLWVPITLVYASMWIFSPGIETQLNALAYPNQSKIISRNTPYGQIAITQLQDQVNVYQNGLWMHTSPDPLSAENSVHFALLQHPKPQSILQIGGGIDQLKEILKHPSVQSVDYIEINPLPIQLIRQNIPEAEAIFNNPRIRIHHQDARQFISQSREPFDVILSHLPNPYTNQINRFYTMEFFELVENHLTNQGIFAFQVAAAENVISPEMSDFLSALHATVCAVFPDVTILPGENQHWLASKKPGFTFSNADRLQQRIKERQLQTHYVQEYYIQYNLSQDRIKHVLSQIHPTDQKNTDFKPLGYYYNTLLWATHFSQGFKKTFQRFHNFHWIHGAILIGAAFLLILLIQQWKPNLPWNRVHLLASIWVVGFTEISIEIILILGFQILWAATYQVIAMLIAAYMLGLSAGSFCSWQLFQNVQAHFKTFRKIQMMMSFYLLICIGILFFCQWIQQQTFEWLIPLIFIFLTFIAGGIGGFQFVLANHLYIQPNKNYARQAGFLYSFDLSGSALGALVCAALLIPVLGLIDCLLLLSILNVCVGLLMFMRRKS